MASRTKFLNLLASFTPLAAPSGEVPKRPIASLRTGRTPPGASVATRIPPSSTGTRPIAASESADNRHLQDALKTMDRALSRANAIIASQRAELAALKAAAASPATSASPHAASSRDPIPPRRREIERRGGGVDRPDLAEIYMGRRK